MDPILQVEEGGLVRPPETVTLQTARPTLVDGQNVAETGGSTIHRDLDRTGRYTLWKDVGGSPP